MAEPASWMSAEPGWEVLDRSGQPVGEIGEVIGDPDADIFDGLRIETGDGEELYVPAEQVGRFEDGQVALDAELGELEPSPAEAEPGGSEISRDRDAELG